MVMGQKTINVNRNGSVLTVDPDLLDLQDGDWVEWKFWGLEEGEFGFISFQPEAGKFGPFHSLRSHGTDSFLGKGNKGEAGRDFSYAALILNLEKDHAAASGSGTIHNSVSKKDTTPDIKVIYNERANTITVTPDEVSLNVGDTATWYFEGVPPNAFVCFKFGSATAADGTPIEEMDGACGPFVAFNACKDEGGTVQASGMGFVAAIPPDRWARQFQYHLQVRDWDGRLLAGHDPIIDNLGPPAPA
jgi:plastocyanin